MALSESVGRRLRSSQEAAGLICTEIKYATFHSSSHQTTLEIPTSSTDVIYRTACALFDELWDGSPIRLLGVRTSKLTDSTEPVQLSLFDLPQNGHASGPSAGPALQKQQKLDAALDAIRQKYGADAIKRGSLLDSRDKYQKH